MSALEPTSAAQRAPTAAHAITSEQPASVQQAATAEVERNFEWGEVDSTSSGFSFSDSETDLLSKAVTAGSPSPPFSSITRFSHIVIVITTTTTTTTPH
jgi:hypothetical protein